MPTPTLINKKIFSLFVVIILILILVWIFVKYRPTQKELSSPVLTSPVPISTIQGAKTYRNMDWGFEFQYPEKWVITREHESLTYYSKFYLTMSVPVKEGKFDETFLVNIVLPEFIRGFDNLEKKSSEIIVAGVQGIKYEYQFEGFPETAVILPFGELRMILGTGGGSKQYLDEFNQILATFKFLK